jgi:hypothetical protein
MLCCTRGLVGFDSRLGHLDKNRALATGKCLCRVLLVDRSNLLADSPLPCHVLPVLAAGLHSYTPPLRPNTSTTHLGSTPPLP